MLPGAWGVHISLYTSLLGFVSPCTLGSIRLSLGSSLLGFVSPWVRLSLCVPCARGSHSSTSYTPCTQAAPPHPSVHPPRIVAGHIAADHMLPIVHRFEGCAHASGAPPLPSKPLASCRALAVSSMVRSIPPLPPRASTARRVSRDEMLLPSVIDGQAYIVAFLSAVSPVPTVQRWGVCWGEWLDLEPHLLRRAGGRHRLDSRCCRERVRVGIFITRRLIMESLINDGGSKGGKEEVGHRLHTDAMSGLSVRLLPLVPPLALARGCTRVQEHC